MACLQYLDYTHKSQKGYQQNSGVFLGFLRGLIRPQLKQILKS